MAPDDLVFLEASWETSVLLPVIILLSNPAIAVKWFREFSIQYKSLRR
jgi:hypothetical protein